jgi:TatA/E family protein of Tat protein translocase
LFNGVFDIGLLVVVGFLIFGPKKLPEIMRTVGKGMAELKRASNELKSSLEEEIRNIDREETLKRDLNPAPKYVDYHSESSPADTQPRT